MSLFADALLFEFLLEPNFTFPARVTIKFRLQRQLNLFAIAPDRPANVFANPMLKSGHVTVEMEEAALCPWFSPVDFCERKAVADREQGGEYTILRLIRTALSSCQHDRTPATLFQPVKLCSAWIPVGQTCRHVKLVTACGVTIFSTCPYPVCVSVVNKAYLLSSWPDPH